MINIILDKTIINLADYDASSSKTNRITELLLL
jgi:hypothetical protein